MDDHMTPVRVQQVGDSRFARFILRDGIGQFFTASGWTDEPSGAALYYRSVDAIEAHNHFYLEGEQPEQAFTTSVRVRVVKGDWSAEELAEHLRQQGKFLVRPSDEQRGVVVEIEWDAMKREEEH